MRVNGIILITIVSGFAYTKLNGIRYINRERTFLASSVSSNGKKL